MADWKQEGKDLFCHIDRGPELIMVGSRDVFAFIPESISYGATSGMKISRDAEGSEVLWETETPIIVEEGERVLLWSRVFGNNTPKIRWVSYIDADNPDDTAAKIKPLREVYSPRVSYDKNSNSLFLWFWTNVNYEYSDSKYLESELYPIGYSDFDKLLSEKKCKRVLCCARGQFGTYLVQGGLINPDGSTSGSDIDSEFGLMPFFFKPIIVGNFDISTAVKPSGIATDGLTPSGGDDGDDIVLAVMGGQSNGGGWFDSEIFGNGFAHASTARATIHAVDVGFDSTLPSNIAVIAHNKAMDVIYTYSEDSSSSG